MAHTSNNQLTEHNGYYLDNQYKVRFDIVSTFSARWSSACSRSKNQNKQSFKCLQFRADEKQQQQHYVEDAFGKYKYK